VTESGQKSGQSLVADGQRGEVVELLPRAVVRVRLEDESIVMAHDAGVAVKNFVRLRPGDRVRVEISPRDRTRGRIVELLQKG
jgi:translation initiation factor IF-1